MTRYFRQAVQALEALIRRINDAVKRSFERAAESKAVAAALWAIVVLYAGLSLWQSPQVWIAHYRSAVASVKNLLNFSMELLDYVASNPVVAAVRQLVEHPLFVRLLIVLAVLRFVFVWITDEIAASAHRRQMAAHQSLKITGAERVHLFAHRFASTVLLLLLIFPGLLILFSDLSIILMFAVILAAIYGAIRLVGWVIAALFE